MFDLQACYITDEVNSLFWLCLLYFLLSALAPVVSSAWDVLSSQGHVPSKSCPPQLPTPLWSLLSLILPDWGNHTFLWTALAQYLTALVTLPFLSCFEVIYAPFLLTRKPFEGRICLYFLVVFPIPCDLGLCTLHSDHTLSKWLF